jgi:Tfp pilus assembly protein PilV
MIKRRAQSILEVVIAIAIMAISITASSAMMISAEKSAGETAIHMQAVAVAEEGIHAVMSIRDRDWNGLLLGAHGLAINPSPLTWVFNGASDSADGFTRTVTVTEVDAHTRKVTVGVRWSPDGRRSSVIEEQILLTDWAFL